jgi:hypothetical protein
MAAVPNHCAVAEPFDLLRSFAGGAKSEEAESTEVGVPSFVARQG